MSPSDTVELPPFLDVLPELLRPYALELFHTMRREPDLHSIDSADLEALVCDDAFRTILVNYAVARGAPGAATFRPK